MNRRGTRLVTLALLGLVLGAFFWTYAVMQLPFGWFIDKVGARIALVGSDADVGDGHAGAGRIVEAEVLQVVQHQLHGCPYRCRPSPAA